ncbi:hypothetical protein A3731_15580 [Roseovarius sp. HI0049]|nr:hypothetical protein A3731_15580 [Roseovarius sp. HI0049]
MRFSEAVKGLAVLVGLALPATAHAQACGAGEALRVDWSDAGWDRGSLSGTVQADRVEAPGEGMTEPVEVSFTGATNRLESGYPVVSSEFTGGRGGGYDALAMQADFGSNNQSVTVRFDFAVPVDGLAFDIFDVDFLPNFLFQRGFRDGVTITGVTEDGGTVMPTLRSPHIPAGQNTSSRATVYLGSPLAANQVVGYGENANAGSDAGNVMVRFGAPVTSVRLEYTNGLYAPSPNPQTQAIALSDIDFCVALAANLEATKTQEVISETPQACGDFGAPAEGAAEAAIPGACIEYRIRVTNTGGGLADDLTLSDELDENLVFRAARISGFESGGPGYGLTTPNAGQSCGQGRCLVSLAEAALPAGATGEVVIRATVQ